MVNRLRSDRLDYEIYKKMIAPGCLIHPAHFSRVDLANAIISEGEATQPNLGVLLVEVHICRWARTYL
jgi:hypothetical protein